MSFKGVSHSIYCHLRVISLYIYCHLSAGGAAALGEGRLAQRVALRSTVRAPRCGDAREADAPGLAVPPAVFEGSSWFVSGCSR